MKIGKTIACVLLSLFMLISMMPSYMFTAFAEGEPAAADEASTELDDGTDDNETPGADGNAEAEDDDDTEEAVPEKGESTDSASKGGTSSGAELAEPEGSDASEDVKEEDAEEEPDEEQPDDSTAGFSSNEGVEGVDVSGPAAEDEDAAAEVLADETDLSAKKAAKIAAKLFAATDEDAEAETEESAKDEPLPSHGDGSNIDVMTAQWITADTTDNDDDALLYIKSDGSTAQQVRLRINYALSGEHSYSPYDITISFPASIFKTRDGKDTGEIIIPYPEDPSKKQDFNWKQVGDQIVLTNTKKMSAATKGYIEIAFDGLDPALIKDMAVSEDFVATIEVSTFKGNTLSLSTDPLTAQFDTEAKLTDVNKRNSSVTRIKADQVPESQRVEGEESYIKVDWYVWGATSANTYYTIDQLDYIPQAKAVQTKTVVEDGDVTEPNTQISVSDAQEYKAGAVAGDTVTTLTEADVKGFVLGAASADDSELEKTNVYYGRNSGRGSDYSFSTIYPASQFEKDTNYTFHNTIKYTVTEKDPEVKDNVNPNVNNGEPDPQLVTTNEASAQVTWSYTDPKWINPGGHYMVHKNGNDDNTKESSNNTHKSIYTYGDLHKYDDGYYGIYPSAINDLQKAYAADGEDGSVRLSYTINTLGYALPWMYDGGYAEFKEGEIPARIIGNYNRPITMTTTDTGVSFGRNGAKLQVGTDYTYEEIQFPGQPYVYKGSPQNINPDGTWDASNYDDGTFKYTSDTDKTNWPDIKLQLQIDGEWQDYATVSWRTGTRVIKLESGETYITTGVVKVPENTQNFRTVVTLQNTAGGEDATEALQAGINYDVRPVINLKSTKSLIDRFAAMFEQSNTPSMAVYNSTNMLIERTDVSERDPERVIHSIDRDGYDSIRGYTTDTQVYPYKEATQYLREVDYENRQILIHYKARVEERSYISDQKTWQEAVNEGNLQSENTCTWYDLLPKGVTPDLSTITLRKGDSLVSADTYENYKGTGRTLLIVKAKLSPVPQTYRSGDMTYYMDVPTISFDATYDFESWKDYGSSIHNVIAFESGNDSLGTIPKYMGEPDDPTSTNNISTSGACVSDEERSAMTDLNRDGKTGADAPGTFVYAGVTTKVDLLAAARTSLYKDVEVNNDGIYNEGTYYTSKEEAKEATEGGNKRTVFEGGQYTYRLRVMSDPDTISAGMVIYDALEDFEAKTSDDGGEADNDSIDIAAVEAGAVWKGTLRSVDVSQLEELGCEPIVYYSTEIKNYNKVGDGDDALTMGIKDDSPNQNNIDLSSSKWIKASDYSGSMSDITAIAIDCTRAKDGSFFTLNPLESAVILVRMKAPSGQEARDLISKTGDWGDSAQAYNNAYLLAASFKEDSGQEYTEDTDRDFIRKDYTKVGLKEYSLTADKAWNDDNDRDGKRPDEITLELYANGKPTEPPTIQTLNIAEGEKSVTFEHIPYTDDDGEKIHYSVVEHDVDGYTADVSVDSQDAQLYHVLNTHVPEKITISGTKTWEGDENYAENRPAAINIELYGNGNKIKTQTVKPDSEGNWSYEFTNLYKYENGKEIEYTVKEVNASGEGKKLDSYVPEYSEDDIDIRNDYHPYGELNVSKTVENVTEVSKEQDFEFTFTFFKAAADSGDEDTPVFDEFDYEILDSEGNAVTGDDGEPLKGKIGTNGTVSIKGGQTIHVVELPEGLSYTVTEESVDGFTLTEKTGDSGTIDPNKAAEASFTNTYRANGLINLEANKKLTGRKINKNQFVFELYEVTVDEDGNEVEVEKPSATNDAASKVDAEGETVSSSEAPVTFGGIRYTQNDHGKTFTYRIKEIDRGKAGYTYSEDVYEAKVTVEDNGDGTLKITPVYYSIEVDEDGNKIEGSEEEVDKPGFTNKYTAEGSVKLQAWKDLPGRDLTDGEFTFELLDENGDPIVNGAESDADDEEASGEVTATNAADGTVTFDPKNVEALNYTQEDIGKTYHYAIREVQGDDDTVTYDTSVYGYEVKIVDNGDGTLYAEQSLATPLFEDESDPSKITGWTTEGAVLPVFKNKLEPGDLSLQKLVKEPSDEDPAQTFKFKVKLIGDDVTDETVTKCTVTAADDSGATGEDRAVEMKDGEFEIGLLAGEKAVFEDIPAGTAYQIYEDTSSGWVLVESVNASGMIEATETAEASFTNKYEPGTVSVQFFGTKTLDGKAAESGKFSFVLKEGDETLQTKTVSDGGFIQFDPITYEEAGEHTYTITEVVPEDEDTIVYDTHSETVTVKVTADGEDLAAEVSYDSDGVRFANTTKPGNLKLTKKTDITTDANKDDEFTFRIRFNNANGQPIGKDSKIYWYTEPASATEDAKKNNEDSGTTKRSLKSKLLSLFDTGKVTQEAEITGNNYEKGQVDTGDASAENTAEQSTDNEQIRTSSRETGSPLASLDPLIIIASAASDIASGTFRGADWRITSDGTLIIGNGDTQTLSGYDIGTGQYGGNPGWPWLNYKAKIKAVQFNGTVKMTGCAVEMFNGCSNLQTFDSTGFDPSEVQSFYRMFNGCSKLTSVDADGWVSSNCLNVACMFDRCTNLKKVITTNWDTSKVVKFWEMFYYCSNLEEIDTRSWVINNVDDGVGKGNSTDLNNMFCGCSKLKDIDSSKWTIYAYEGWYWFGSCRSFRRLDLSNIQKPKSGWSGSCTALTGLSIFTIGPNTFNNSSAQFPSGSSGSSANNWKRVSTGEVKTASEWNRSWRGASMAGRYERMTATIYSNGEMIIDWGYDESRTDEIVNTYVIDDTSDTPGWYNDSFKSKITKVTINTEFAPKKTVNWFNGMSSLKTVNGLENLKMTNLTNMKDMFKGCTSLESINLPENFSFKGNNITSTTIQALLPTPPTTDGFIGMWVRDDYAYGPFTPEELRDEFKASMAGTWIWAVDDSIAMLTFKGNGGYPESTRITVDSPDEYATMPDQTTTSRPHYALVGWNTAADGSGTMYDPGATVGGLFEMGRNKNLYAIWETTDLRSYKVEHYQQKQDGSGYTLADTDYPDMVAAGTEVTPEVKTYKGFLSPDPQTAVVLDDDSLVIKYYYDRLAYKVHFDPNGDDATGSMSDQEIQGGTMTALSPNNYKRDGYLFTGWTTNADGSGNYYIDEQKVRDLTKTDGETVTLYAKWLSKDDAELEPTNGEIIVKCKAGETIVIPELPAGTTYTIEEIGSPEGWTQSGEIDGNDDAIAANVTKYATANNAYKAEGEAVIKAHKSLEGGSIEPGQFTFELYKDAELTDRVETKTNGAVDNNEQTSDGSQGSNPYYQTAEVEFTPIDLTQDDIGKTLTYYIRETNKDAAEEEGITIDESVYKVDIEVEDAGSGVLTANVTYTDVSDGSKVSGEPVFVNTMKPAALEISKTIVNATDPVSETQFTFTVELKDADGNDLSGQYDVKIGDDESKISSGGTLKLKGGEKAVISGLPHGATYTVTESAVKNWDQTDKTGDTGTLRPGRTSEASFTNTFTPPPGYEAEGSAAFKAVKEVEGGALLADDDFTFELLDESGNVIQTKGPDKVSSDEETITSSDITFDAINYTIDDLPYPTEAVETSVDQKLEAEFNAKGEIYETAKAIFDKDTNNKDKEFTYEEFYTLMHKNQMKQYLDEMTAEAEAGAVREADFIYYVREVTGDDPDVQYDSSRYYFKVHAVDNGLGVIETTVTKWKMGSETDPDTGEVIAKDTEITGDNEITFTNSKSAQIKINKRWSDGNDVDGYRPAAQEFAAKIHLMNGENEVTGYTPEITEDADGNLTIVYSDLPAYDADNKKITYTVKEDAIDNYKAKDDITEAANGETLVNVHQPDTVDLKLTKKLDGYYDGGEDSNVTVGFSIVAYDKKDHAAGKKTVIWHTFASLEFNKGDDLTKELVISNVPKEAVVEVTEEYAYGYSAEDGEATQTAEYDTDNDAWTVTFKNKHGNDDRKGSGIVNSYVDGNIVKKN